MLTDIQIRSLRPSDRVQRVRDAGGLTIEVSPTGRKRWRLAYRIDGRQTTMLLGEYPDMRLVEARHAREAAKAELRAGRDPKASLVPAGKTVEVRPAANADVEPGNPTFAMVAGEWFGLIAREGRAAQTMRKKAWFLEFLRREADGFVDMPVRTIRPKHVIAAMRVFEGRGQLPAAHNLRTFVSQVMRYAVINEHADIDPAAAVAGAVARPSSAGLQGITDRRRFGELLRACRAYGGMPQTRAGLLLSAYLAPRSTELRGMRWDEIDVGRARWNVPGARMKKKLDHVVPLPRQALEVLEWIRPHTGRHDLVLYSGQGKRSAMLSEITFNKGKRPA